MTERPIHTTEPTPTDRAATAPPLLRASVDDLLDDRELIHALSTATISSAWRAFGEGVSDLYAIEVRLAPDRFATFVVRVDHARSSTVGGLALLAADATAAMEVGAILGGDRHRPMWRRCEPAQLRVSLDHALDVPRRPLGVHPSDPHELLRPLLIQMVQCLPTGGARISDEDADEYAAMARELRLQNRYRPPRRSVCEELQLRSTMGMRSRTVGGNLHLELRALVGGADALASLDPSPLPDERFDPTGVTDDLRPRVDEILELCDRACDQHFDIEVRTATRRLLHRIATSGAASLRASGSAHTAAAAIVWTVATRNHLLGRHRLSTKDLLQSFAVSGSVSSRARSLLRAAGLRPDAHAPEFSASMLTGARRAELMSLRGALEHSPVLRLRVELLGTDPVVQRVVDVSGDRELDHLHDVLQVAFGWHGTRPAEFRIGDLVAGVDASAVERGPAGAGPVYPWAGDPWAGDPWLGDPWSGDLGGGGPLDLDAVIAATDLRLGMAHPMGDETEPVDMEEVGLGVLSEGDTFAYHYGGRWIHALTVESVTTLLDHEGTVPGLCSASRAAPPEAVGDPAGYQRMLQLMGTDREYELAELTSRCLPPRHGSFDPWRPDPDVVDTPRLTEALSKLAA